MVRGLKVKKFLIEQGIPEELLPGSFVCSICDKNLEIGTCQAIPYNGGSSAYLIRLVCKKNERFDMHFKAEYRRRVVMSDWRDEIKGIPYNPVFIGEWEKTI